MGKHLVVGQRLLVAGAELVLVVSWVAEAEGVGERSPYWDTTLQKVVGRDEGSWDRMVWKVVARPVERVPWFVRA